MKFTIEQSCLEKLLSTVTRASESKPILPILGNVLLETFEEKLLGTGTDIQMMINSEAECLVEESGSITLPAKELMALVSTLTGSISISVDDKMAAHIKSGKSKFKLLGIGAENFPPGDVYATQESYAISREALVNGLDQTLYVCNPNASDIRQRGMSFFFTNSGLRLYATSGFRIAQSIIGLESSPEADLEMILPMRSLIEVKNIFARSESESLWLRIYRNEKDDIRRVSFEDDRVTVASQIIDGAMARMLETFLPTVKVSVKANVDELQIALKRMSIFSMDSNNAVELKFENGQLGFNAKSQERGQGEDSIEVEYAGELITQTYNVRFLLDAITSFGGSEVVLLNLRESSANIYILTVESQIESNLIAAMSPMATS